MTLTVEGWRPHRKNKAQAKCPCKENGETETERESGNTNLKDRSFTAIVWILELIDRTLVNGVLLLQLRMRTEAGKGLSVERIRLNQHRLTAQGTEWWDMENDGGEKGLYLTWKKNMDLERFV